MTSTTSPAPPSTPDPTAVTGPPDRPGPVRGRWARLVLGPPDDPRWARPALLGLLVATAVLYLWGLARRTRPTRSRWTRRRPRCG